MALFKITRTNKKIFGEEKFHTRPRSEREITDMYLEKMTPKMTHFFRCLDDDGEPYFWGVCSSENFLPLDLVGEQYGCTTIQYLNKNGEYETL
jgi:hypothetical protein